MRFIGSSSSNVNSAEGMVYGNGKEVKMRLEQHRQTQPKALQHPSDSVAPIISSEGGSDDQPGMLHKEFLVPAHHTNFPVSGEQDLTASEIEGNFLAFPTPDDYKCEQELSSDDVRGHKQQTVKAAQKNKPTRRMSHEKVHKNNFRRAMEAAVEVRRTRRQKRGNKRQGSMKMNNKDVELTAEEQAMREFPGIPVQKAMEDFARKEEARAARALEPNFIYDEQRLVMESFEAEHRQQQELVDQLEHEEEVAGWMIGDNVEDGFGVGIDDGMDVGVFDRGFWMVNGLEDQDDLAWMEGDDAFGNSSLALTPPHH